MNFHELLQTVQEQLFMNFVNYSRTVLHELRELFANRSS